MRTLASFIMITVDGFYAGPNDEFDWPTVDDEFNDFGVKQLDEAGTLVFGRVTYDGMASYWPSAAAIEDSAEVAARMNRMQKVVFSSTLDQPGWSNATVARGNLATEMSALKARAGGELLVLGSPALTASLIDVGLLDELRLMVAPMSLGNGKALFGSAPTRRMLHLLHARPFSSGNVLLTYRPKSA